MNAQPSGDGGGFRRVMRYADRLSLWGIAAGLALELQPFSSDGLRAGFLVTLAAVALQIVSSHLAAAPAPD